jgi:hypothetical protein
MYVTFDFIYFIILSIFGLDSGDVNGSGRIDEVAMFKIDDVNPILVKDPVY